MQPELTTRGKPYVVHFHAGEMFVFELTPAQEANQKVAADEMIGVEFLPRLEVAPAPAQLVEINDLVIDGHTQVDKSQPIRGRCSYVRRSAPPDSLHSVPPELLRSAPLESMPFPPLESMPFPTGAMPFPPQLPMPFATPVACSWTW